MPSLPSITKHQFAVKSNNLHEMSSTLQHANPNSIACTLALPPDYRTAELFGFHSRDTSETDARVVGNTIQKGICWNDAPACLSITCEPGVAHAHLSVDGETRPADSQRLEAVLVRMMGLNQPVDAFEHRYSTHPVLGKMIAAHPGLRIPGAPSPFEALTWAVIGQQISLSAAISIRRRLLTSLGHRHSSGFVCHPSAETLALSSIHQLTAAGLSKGKAATLKELANRICTGEIDMNTTTSLPAPEAIAEALLSIKGIGPWTVSYTLLRGFGYLDGSLHGDVAMRRSLQRLRGDVNAVTAEDARTWLAEFTPWRALVAAHLWAMLHIAA